MIYTVTINPAVDVIIDTEGFKIGETNYYKNTYSLVGGKGFNVSFILNELEVQTITLGFLGKENSIFFKNKFKEEKIKTRFIEVDGLTRHNYKIKNINQNEETELNGEGFYVTDENIDNILLLISENIKKGDILVASGSLPKSVDKSIYKKFGEICNSKLATFILDTSKKQLTEALEIQPYLIKPNMEEICDVLGYTYENRDYDLTEIKLLISRLWDMGARNILLSMGSKGAFFFSEDKKIYQAGIAKGKLVNSVGSGDSMLAGFVYGISKNFSNEDKLRYATACGGATAFSQWLATKDDILKYLKTIEIKEIL